MKMINEYQPNEAGGTCSPPGMSHHPKNPNQPPGGPKIADMVWKEVIRHSDELLLKKCFDSIIPSMKISKIQNCCQGKVLLQFSLNRFFDLSPPSMRKVKKIPAWRQLGDSLTALKEPMGSEKSSNPRLLDLPINFC